MDTRYPWADTETIQRTFFRTGAYTNLFIAFERDILSWTFTHREFGMDSSLSKSFRLERRGEDRWAICDQSFANPTPVDGDVSSDEMLIRVFHGHYKFDVRNFYNAIQFNPDPAGTGDDGTHY